MNEATPRSNLGRHLFGVAAVTLGLITLAWHVFNDWHLSAYIVYLAAAGEIFGGAAIQFRRTAKAGEQPSLARYILLSPWLACRESSLHRASTIAGATFSNSFLSRPERRSFLRDGHRHGPRETLNRIGRILFGLCAASFALEQAFYLAATASLVPKWIPPTQMFWAVTTTVSFALAAVALLANRMALLAARLLTMMLLLFGLLVWIPLLLSNARSYTNWSETTETFAIAGAAWILADLLAE